jgi:hypothetical protein
MQYFRIDEDGYYLEPVIAHYSDNSQMPDELIAVQPPNGLYRAKWTGTEWVEVGEPPEPVPEPMSFQRATALMSAKTFGFTMEAVEEAEAQATVMSAAGFEPAPAEKSKWTTGEYVGIGSIREHGGTDYRCVQAHVTQGDWTPPAVPALWAVAGSGAEKSEWKAGEPVEAGWVRTYKGVDYVCVTGHTTQAGWTPDVVAALWGKA